MIKNYSLYLIISEEYARGRTAIEVAKAAIAGGVDIIQMREKNKSREELVRLGKELSALCRKTGVLFIVNDDPYRAREVNADGVHLGTEDLKVFTVEKTREILGKDKIIGLSASSAKEVEAADRGGADYIGFGPVFSTPVKDSCAGTADISRIMAKATKPVFFIGGINLSGTDEVLRLGGKNIALIRAISKADDIEAAAREFKRRLDETRDGKTSRAR